MKCKVLKKNGQSFVAKIFRSLVKLDSENLEEKRGAAERQLKPSIIQLL